jgi:hypothetical protein
MSTRPEAMPRRSLLTRTAAVGAFALAGTGSLTPAAASRSRSSSAVPPAERDVIVVGANPGISLFDGETVTAYASVWQVDWSPDGAGNVLVLWRRDEVRLIGSNAPLARRLEREFTRFFPEVDGLPWPRPRVERHPVYVDIDLNTGLRAIGGDVVVLLSEVLQRRTFATDEFDLGGVPHSLSLVLGPCAEGRIIERGRGLPGEIQRGGTPEQPSSSAFVTEAEVWKR